MRTCASILSLRCVLAFVSVVGLVALGSATPATTQTDWPGLDLFTNGAPQKLELDIAAPEMASLTNEPRTFVRATFKEGSVVYTNVAVHLKGSVGSFRSLDDKPGFTLDFSHFNAGQKFHGLRRIHLNNSVEDPSYANELIGGELFRTSGVPAPRVGHAIVVLNGRRLGLYVLLEGFTEDFLGCYYKQVGGNLYEPGEGHDVNQSLKRNSVHAPIAQSRLQLLAEAALEGDRGLRWHKLQRVLDTDEFLRFMALEVLLCHRDGYSLARNNYRVYENPETGKIEFFPHGMDQLFGRPDLPCQPHMAGVVAKAVMDTPEGLQRYREVFATLFTNVFDPVKISRTCVKVSDALRPSITPAEAAALEQAGAQLKERLLERHRFVASQVSQPPLALLPFTNNVGNVTRWEKAEEPADGEMAVERTPSGENLHIVARSDTAASWRAQTLLESGHYRFEGRARVSGVKPLPFGRRQGASLRLASIGKASPGLSGDCAWQPLSTEFTVTNGPTLVECICELRAHSGEAWFEVPSLKLIRMNP